jgi:hypothetical protein
MPPWCPKCGADLKGPPDGVAASAPLPVMPAAAAAVARQPAAAPMCPVALPPQPPYFRGVAEFTLEAERHYRVYVRKGELLFLYVPTPQEGRPQQMPALWMFGLMGAVISAIVTSCSSNSSKAREEERKERLDWADEGELVRMASDEPNSFRAAVADLSDVRIVAPSFWRKLGGGCPTAFLCFRHFEMGSYKVQLPRLTDLRIALEELLRLLGDQLTVASGWARMKKGIVARMKEGVVSG